MTEKELLKQALQEYFNPNGENKKFFDSSQIPRVCNDISSIKKSIEVLEQRMSRELDDHENRIRKLEQNMWRNAGIASVLGSLGVWVLQRFV